MDEADPPSAAMPERRSPRVLFPNDVPPARLDAASPSGPAVLFGAVRPPAPRGDAPRILASGEVRRRVACSEAALRALDADAPAAVVSQALRIVDGVNLDDHHFDDVVRFGADLQAEHGRLAEQDLAVAGSEVLAEGRRLGADLLELLRALDPNVVFAVRGGLLKVLGALIGGRDADLLFPTHYPRIQALARRLDVLGPEIGALAEQLREAGRGTAALERGLGAHILAGRFLVRHIAQHAEPDPDRQAHFSAQAEALETRVASLLATEAAVALGRRTQDALALQVDALALAGQGLLREDLPAWHGAYAAALSAARSARGGADAMTLLQSLHARLLGRFIGKG